jgi:hypothetical protein
LIKLTEGEAKYNPSEAELQTIKLNDYQQQLIAANLSVVEAYTPHIAMHL